jgi:hypothetical protein
MARVNYRLQRALDKHVPQDETIVWSGRRAIPFNLYWIVYIAMGCLLIGFTTILLIASLIVVASVLEGDNILLPPTFYVLTNKRFLRIEGFRADRVRQWLLSEVSGIAIIEAKGKMLDVAITRQTDNIAETVFQGVKDTERLQEAYNRLLEKGT